ncbi:hypothetical protein HanIR_Chr10g0451101 [Helianthus annuus]|nr:hypothetical protein HanIR_Chr10g0451101 [Helianthus annuus]
MNFIRSEPSNRPIFFYVRTYDIGTFKKVNPLKNIPGSATANIDLISALICKLEENC